jgi:esterase/lipase superfamily enzyme
LSLLAFAALPACKTPASGSRVAAADYVTPASGELRLNWYTSRLRDYAGGGTSDFTGEVNQGFAEKGVVDVRVGADYRFGGAVLSAPKLTTDDVRYNQELVYGVYDQRYRGRATVFVHGYNHTAENSVERAAQLFAALDRPPAQRPFVSKAFAFGWPSAGRVVDDLDIVTWLRTGTPFFARAYSHDELAAAASQTHLAEFLTQLCQPSYKYREINVVAHSLGTRLTSDVLAWMSRTYQAQLGAGQDPRQLAAQMPCGVKNLILASGDIGILRFQAILPDLLLIADKITLYINSTLIEQMLKAGVTADVPLALSKLLHLFGQFELGPRIGQQSVFSDLLDKKVDIVVMKYLHDAPDGTGHMQVFSNPSVLSDIAYLLNGEPSPLRRTRPGLLRSTFILQ